jgi:hypothetical protein
MLRRLDTLDADDQLTLKQVRARCPHLDSAADHVARFAEMMVGRHGERLDAWICRSRPTTNRTCTGSPTASAVITPPCSTVCHCRTAPAPWKDR